VTGDKFPCEANHGISYKEETEAGLDAGTEDVIEARPGKRYRRHHMATEKNNS